jgi:hypothetical protein
MAYSTSVQVMTFSLSELFPYPKILFTQQTLPRKGWNQVHRTNLLSIQNWFKNGEIHATFTTRRETCPPGPYKQCVTPPRRRCQVSLAAPRQETYLAKNIFTRRNLLGITLTKMYRLLGRKSQLSTSNKLLIYKTILILIWTYGIQIWGTASTSNIEILERFQSKASKYQ